MNDPIERADAINEIVRWKGYLDEDMIERIQIGLKKLPPAQSDQRWISSGEKPPEEGSYLVWMPFAPPKHRMAVAEYCGGYWNIKTPISAWMPLPDPFQERKK